MKEPNSNIEELIIKYGKKQMKVKKGTTIPKKITDWLKNLSLSTIKQK